MKKLVFILGSQRSGTTALEYILSTNSNLFAIGEVRLLENFIKNNAKIKLSKGRCTCGKLITRCPFWSRVFNQMECLYDVKIEDLITNISREEHLRALYESIDHETDEILIDSSKNIEYINTLAKALPDWDISIIYIYRDPFQVSLSARKWHKKIGRMRRPQFVSMIRWLRSNFRMRLWLIRHREIKYLVLRYEDFVSDPLVNLRKVSDVIGIQGDYSLKLNLRDLHTVAGTPTRFESNEFVLSSTPLKNQIKGNFIMKIFGWFITRICNFAFLLK